MTALEENRAQLDRLQARMKEYQEQLKAEADSQKRAALKAKISSYRAAIRDVQVQIDHLDPPQIRRARKAQRKRLDIGALSFDFFERSGTCWSDIEGHSWQQVEAGDFVELGTGMDQLQGWLAEGAQRLTDRQRLYIDAYYNQGLSLERIAREQGADKSTVSRVIRNGMARMQEWVEAKKLIASCADGKGGFDWARYLAQVPVLTDWCSPGFPKPRRSWPTSWSWNKALSAGRWLRRGAPFGGWMSRAAHPSLDRRFGAGTRRTSSPWRFRPECPCTSTTASASGASRWAALPGTATSCPAAGRPVSLRRRRPGSWG